MILKLFQVLFFIALTSVSSFAANEKDKDIEIMEKWSLTDEQQKLAPISSPVDISIDTVDGRIDSLILEITNTQPPSLLSNKAVSTGKRRVWLKSVGIVIRPTDDYFIWLPGAAKGEKERKGNQPFSMEGDAKVYVEKDGVMIRTIVRMKLDIQPYQGGYGATIYYNGERKANIGKGPETETSVLTESGSNPVFTIRGVNDQYEISVRGRVDIKMSDYKKLYEGIWSVDK